MHSAASLLASVLPGLLQHAPLTPEKVAFAWRTVAGDAVARATSVRLGDGVLWVSAEDDGWLREVERAAVSLLPRMKALIGDDAVRVIRVFRRSPRP
jgi:predicted nucleic acid-binding Zn ribbon protein